MKKVAIVSCRSDFESKGFDVDFSKTSAYDTSNVFVARGLGSWAAATKGKTIIHALDIEETIKKVIDCDIIVICFIANKNISNNNDIVALSLALKQEGKIVFLHYAESLRWFEIELSSEYDYISKIIEITHLSECDGHCYCYADSKFILWEQFKKLINKPVEYVPICFDKNLASPFRTSPDERKGIVIPQGLFDLYCPRYTLGNMAIAANLEEPTTLIWKGPIDSGKARHLKDLFVDKNKISIIHGDKKNTHHGFVLDWHGYLKIISQHRICIDMDLSFTLSGFSADATLLNIPCLGGNSNVGASIFRELVSNPTDMNEIMSVAKKLLKDDKFYYSTIEEMDNKIEKEFSFETNRKIWEEIYNKYKNLIKE